MCVATLLGILWNVFAVGFSWPCTSGRSTWWCGQINAWWQSVKTTFWCTRLHRSTQLQRNYLVYEISLLILQDNYEEYKP